MVEGKVRRKSDSDTEFFALKQLENLSCAIVISIRTITGCFIGRCLNLTSFSFQASRKNFRSGEPPRSCRRSFDCFEYLKKCTSSEVFPALVEISFGCSAACFRIALLR
jgi:hypothetical protein